MTRCKRSERGLCSRLGVCWVVVAGSKSPAQPLMHAAVALRLQQEDSSLTRSNSYMLDLFRRTGFTLLSNVQQREFPRELFQVRMYALRPRAA